MGPNFDWSNFGPKIVKWMKEFKTLEVEGIIAKKVAHEANLAIKACPDTRTKMFPTSLLSLPLKRLLRQLKMISQLILRTHCLFS